MTKAKVDETKSGTLMPWLTAADPQVKTGDQAAEPLDFALAKGLEITMKQAYETMEPIRTERKARQGQLKVQFNAEALRRLRLEAASRGLQLAELVSELLDGVLPDRWKT